MKPARTHHAGEPSTPEPPERLLAVADTCHDPQVRQCGVTTTADGRWALYVTVPADATVPIASIERQADGFPVVYEAELPAPVRAGPAFPGRRR
ncbi:hypothetical protein [Variovorax sp. KK3]|uniref:hypothetical protein n=1 Tax=Variovorax sp. KK3 TaxID=1855728 RepID=UPI00097BBB7E|nr:hypothetical protein [Variovorax sp. KK3]